MSSENVIKNLRALWRTDGIIAEIRMKHMLVGLGLRAFAALIAAFGFLMLELAAYFALVQIWSAISAAAILGLVNFVIAANLFAISAKPPAGRELDLANEIHGSAVDALQMMRPAAWSTFHCEQCSLVYGQAIIGFAAGALMNVSRSTTFLVHASGFAAATRLKPDQRSASNPTCCSALSPVRVGAQCRSLRIAAQARGGRGRSPRR